MGGNFFLTRTSSPFPTPDSRLPTPTQRRLSLCPFPFRPFALSGFRDYSPPGPLPSAKCLIDRTNYISRSAHEGVRSYKTLEFAAKKQAPPGGLFTVYCSLITVYRLLLLPARLLAAGTGGLKFRAGAMDDLLPLALACRPAKNAFHRCAPRATKSLPEALA